MSSRTGGLIECVVCSKRFQIEDFGKTYLFDQRHCISCYLHKLGDDSHCFGGWTPNDLGQELCGDRTACKMFSLGTGMVRKVLTNKKKAELLQLLKIRKVRRSSRFNPLHPFTKGSIRRALFDKALAGTTRAELEDFCKRIGSSYPVQIKVIKRGYGNGHIWEYHETTDGKIWVDYTPEASALLFRNSQIRGKNGKGPHTTNRLAK
jgi:hypothetical protein